MASHNKTLKLIATKLGLAEEENVLKKAAEFERLLQTKSIAGSNMTDTSKTVICLDLAAAIFGANLENKTAIKYSGLRGPSYMNCKKIVENLLELNSERLTVSFLCLSLQCTGVQSLAEKILEYQMQKSEIDLSLPQYVCMAVYQACRLNKVKVSKSKLLEKSRLKPGQWAKLDADWTKVVDEKFATVNKRGRPSKNVETICTDGEKMEVDVPSPSKENDEPEMEPYEDWKKRMLETAYKELEEKQRNEEKLKKEKKRNQEKENNLKEKQLMEREFRTLRRSPRKTPQKYSPYKSPKKPITAIRLLFPKE